MKYGLPAQQGTASPPTYSTAAPATINRDELIQLVSTALQGHDWQEKYNGSLLRILTRYMPSLRTKVLTTEKVKSALWCAMLPMPLTCEGGYCKVEDCELCAEVRAMRANAWKRIADAFVRYDETGQVSPPAEPEQEDEPAGTHVCQRPGCGALFNPQGKTSRYCSPNCRKRHHEELHRS